MDIGGSKIRTGLISEIPKPLLISKTPKQREKILSAIELQIDKIIAQVKLNEFNLVVGCPGLISPRGEIDAALYWPATGLKLKEMLANKYSCEVTVFNDANLQALGTAREVGDGIYLSFGTGVGGGIVLGGTVYAGVSGYAGEFGHISVSASNRICLCGRAGCLDTVASGYWLERLLGEGWWCSPGSERFKVAVRDAGTCTANAIHGIIICMDVRKVTMSGHIVQYAEFREALVQTLNTMMINVELSYVTETWPLVVKGASRLSSLSGEMK